jgi:HEPN domain-containing protein
VNRTELQWLAKERIREAKVLLDAQHWSGAYYLAGYAVECAMKACIAKRMHAEEFPDKSLADKCWTHNLAQLLVAAELKDDFDAAKQADTDLRENWDIVRAWTEASRYARKKRAAAQDLYDAITDRKHGVFSWLKLRF